MYSLSRLPATGVALQPQLMHRSAQVNQLNRGDLNDQYRLSAADRWVESVSHDTQEAQCPSHSTMTRAHSRRPSPASPSVMAHASPPARTPPITRQASARTTGWS